MRRIEFLVLMTLAEGPAHGYGMVTGIREASGGSVSVEPGNLYRRIRALESQGLVEPMDSPADETRRRYYRLTAAGRDAFLEETARLARLASAAGAIASKVSG